MVRLHNPTTRIIVHPKYSSVGPAPSPPALLSERAPTETAALVENTARKMYFRTGRIYKHEIVRDTFAMLVGLGLKIFMVALENYLHC